MQNLTMTFYDLEALKQISKEIKNFNLPLQELDKQKKSLKKAEKALKVEQENIMKTIKVGIKTLYLDRRLCQIGNQLVNLNNELAQTRDKIASLSLARTSIFLDCAFSWAVRQQACLKEYKIEELSAIDREDLQTITATYQRAIQILKESSSSYENKQMKVEVAKKIVFLKSVINEMRSLPVIKQNNKVIISSEEEISHISKEQQRSFFNGEILKFKTYHQFSNFYLSLMKYYSFESIKDYLLNFDITALNQEDRYKAMYFLKKTVVKKEKQEASDKDTYRKSSELKRIMLLLDNMMLMTLDSPLDQVVKNRQRCFTIITHLLEKENAHFAIKKLFARGTNYANAISDSNHHILEYLLNNFEVNMYEKLKNQSKDYRDPAIYANLFITLLQSPLLELTPALEEIKNNRLNEILQKLSESTYKSERKQEFIEMLNQMSKPDEVIKNTQTCKVNFDELDFTYRDLIHDESRRDCTQEFTIKVKNEDVPYSQIAYSVTPITDDYSKYWLNVHVSDISSYLNRSVLDEDFLANKILADVKNEDYLLNKSLLRRYFSLEVGKLMPVTSYHLLVNARGHVEGLYVNEGLIKVDQEYTKEQLSNREIRKTDEIKPFVIVSKWLSDDEMTDSFNVSVLRTIGHYFNKHKLPFIYNVCTDNPHYEIFDIVGSMNHLFGDLSDEDYRVVMSSICEKKKTACYSVQNKGHHELNRQYHADLLRPLDSYVGILLQQLTKIMATNQEPSITKDQMLSIAEQANKVKTRG